MIEEGFYRPHITTVSTPSSMTGDALQGDNCSECHATYGHRISCSTLFRGSAACRFTDTDTILAHGLGVDLTK